MSAMQLKIISKPVLAGILLLPWCVVSGGDVSVPPMAVCVAQFEDDVDLGVELCQAKRARALLSPGSGHCASSWRLVEGRISCDKSDSASEAAAARPGFSSYYSTLNTPVLIDSLGSFYADMRAGEHFQINNRSGSLKIMDSRRGSGASGGCVVPPNTRQCVVKGRFTDSQGSKYSEEKTDYSYTLQLDGLLVEEETHRKICAQEHCALGYCWCRSYAYPPSVKNEELHLWRQGR